MGKSYHSKICKSPIRSKAYDTSQQNLYIINFLRPIQEAPYDFRISTNYYSVNNVNFKVVNIMFIQFLLVGDIYDMAHQNQTIIGCALRLHVHLFAFPLKYKLRNVT